MMRDLYCAPMVPLPDSCGSVEALYAKFDIHIKNNKQVYELLRGICLNAAEAVYSASNEELKRFRNEKKLAGCFFPIGGVDDVRHLWSQTIEDDIEGTARKCFEHVAQVLVLMITIVVKAHPKCWSRATTMLMG
jgi:hypothetical protein